MTVYASGCGLLDSGNGLNALGTDKDNFGNLVKGKTDRVVEKNGKRLKLTQLEYQIMKLFMENPDKALTRELPFFGRFLLAPGLVYLMYLLLPVPTLMVKVFMIQAAMPAITQAALLAKTSGADYRYATIMVSATNLASLAVLPLYMALFTVLFPA